MNYFEKTDIEPTQFVTPTSRYADSTVVYYTERKLLTFNTYKKHELAPNENDKFMVVTKQFEYRPDLVSNAAYSTPDFWWKIMEANEIKDVFDFKAGLNIRIPYAVFL